MSKDGTEIKGAYSHGIKVDLGNNKKMIFVTGQIAQDKIVKLKNMIYS